MLFTSYSSGNQRFEIKDHAVCEYPPRDGSWSLPASDSPNHSSVSGYLNPVSGLCLCAHMALLSLWLCLHMVFSFLYVCLSSSYKDTSHIGLEAHPTVVQFHLNFITSGKTLFHIKSYLQVLGFTLSVYLLGGHSSTHNDEDMDFF